MSLGFRIEYKDDSEPMVAQLERLGYTVTDEQRDDLELLEGLPMMFHGLEALEIIDRRDRMRIERRVVKRIGEILALVKRA